MKYCHIKGCVAANKDDLAYFRIPFRPEIRTKWIEAIAKHQEFDFSNASFMICESHFDEKEVLRSQPNDSHLKRGAVPSIFPSIYCDESQNNPLNNEQQNITHETSEEDPLLIPKCTQSPIGSPHSIKIEKGIELPVTTGRGTTAKRQSFRQASRKNAPVAKRPQATKSLKPVPKKRSPAPKSVKITAKPMKIPPSPARITAKTPTVTTTLGKKTASGRVPKMSRRLQESNYFVKPIKQEKNTDLPSFPIIDNIIRQRPSKPPQNNSSAVRRPNITPLTKQLVVKTVSQLSKKASTPAARPLSSSNIVTSTTHVTPNIASQRISSPISSPMPSPILSQSQSQPQSSFIKVPAVSTDTVTISRSFFVKLTKTSIELTKASETISQLKASNQEKDVEIRKLQDMLDNYKRNAQNQGVVRKQPSFTSPENKRKRIQT